MKKRLIFLFSMIFTAMAIHAQSADCISELLETQKATMGQVSYLCASHLGIIEESASYEEALTAMKEAGVIRNSKRITVNTPVRMGQFTLILSKCWNIQESLFYKLLKNKRYAFMQCKALGIIPTSTTSVKIVTGREVLNYVTICNEMFPDGGLEPVSKKDSDPSAEESIPSAEERAPVEESRTPAEETAPVEASKTPAEETAPVEESSAPAEAAAQPATSAPAESSSAQAEETTAEASPVEVTTAESENTEGGAE